MEYDPRSYSVVVMVHIPGNSEEIIWKNIPKLDVVGDPLVCQNESWMPRQVLDMHGIAC